MYDGLIFDLDGTLWSSVENCNRAICKMKRLHPEIREFSIEQSKSTMGYSNEQTRQYYFNEFSLEKSTELCTEFLAEISKDVLEKGATLYDGAVDTLRKLKKTHKLFIVSNCGHGFVEAFMHQTGTEDIFDDYEYCERTGLEKGGNIRLIVERNNLKNAAYIGDTVMDKTGAEQAGIDFIYASYGFGNLEAEKRIESICDIFNVL